MKKLLLAVALLAFIGLGTSCSKAKVCTCEYKISLLTYEQTYSVDKIIESGSCSDLEKDASQWNIQGLSEGSVHCVKK